MSGPFGVSRVDKGEGEDKEDKGDKGGQGGRRGRGRAIYNVAGQRISKLQKGINIVNGKKILK